MVITFLPIISWYCYIVWIPCVPLHWLQKSWKIASFISIHLLFGTVIFLPRSYRRHVSILYNVTLYVKLALHISKI